MGAKKIKKRGRPDVERVNRSLHAITRTVSGNPQPDVAPVPIWELTRAIPDDPDAPLPAIRPELVDPVVVVADPHLVADFEKTGLRIARLRDSDQGRVLLWLIDKSRALSGRRVDDEFAIDYGPEIKSRMIGGTLAELARKGHLRIVATFDESKVIIQMIFGPEDYSQDPAEIEAQFRRLFPNKPH